MAKAVTQVKNNPSSTNQKPLCSTLSLPCITEYVGVARLAISGIANQLGFDIEEIEDLKIAISEACTNVIQHAYDNPEEKTITIKIKTYKTKIEISVEDQGKGFDSKNPVSTKKDNDELGLGLGLAFIKSLMTSCTIESENNKGTIITMTKEKEIS